MKFIFRIGYLLILTGQALANIADTPPRIDPNFAQQSSDGSYGDAAYRAHELGRCVVRATVTADGRTLEMSGTKDATQIETSSGYSGYLHLDWGCTNWVTKFHWIPATHDGHPIQASTTVTIDWIDSGRGSAIGMVVGVPIRVIGDPKPYVEPPPVAARAPSTKTIVAQATDRNVRILVAGGRRVDAPAPQVVTGDVIPAAALITIIFMDSPCTLDIEGAETMRRAWQYAGAYQLGCWYPARGDGWQFVGQINRMDYNHAEPWEAMPRALLHADGSATITEPNYDSLTFMANWYDRRNAHLLDHLHDKP